MTQNLNAREVRFVSIPEGLHQERVDAALSRLLGLSRSTVVTLIENGEITEPLREGNLIGNGPQVLRDIDRLGNDFAMGNPGTCGKDGQGVPVGDGQPTLRVKSMTIGGTAS